MRGAYDSGVSDTRWYRTTVVEQLNSIKLSKAELSCGFKMVIFSRFLGYLKDTVLISSSVPRWPGHVEQNQVGALRLVDHHLIQLDSRVHATNIRLVPESTRRGK